ncbi:MAG: helix-turn-helix domain-containing protein [Vicinamibacterales bacterium]
MPSTSESARAPDLPSDCAVDTTIRSPQAFCLALKTARERRGITIAEIAAATKVCPSHFVALERGDVRRWPKGLFRRAFFRGYVEKIGLPVAETMDEFVQLFPDDQAAAPIARPVPAASTLRLSLDISWRGPKAPIRSRILTAAADACAVLVLAAAVMWLTGMDVATIAAGAAMSYFALATVLLGDSPMAWAIRWRRTRVSVTPEPALTEPVTSQTRIAWAWRRGSEMAALVFGTAGDHTSEESRGEREERIWSNARRVRPRHAPTRLRVRFKLP